MRAEFRVAEQRFPDLQIGREVLFGLDGDDMPYKGAITGIDPKIDPASRLASARAEISNPDGKLSPGQFVQVRVVLPSEENIIAVPQTAVITSLYGDYVYVVRPAAERKAGAAAAGTEPAKEEAAAADAAKPAEPAKADDKQSLVANQVFVTIGRRSDGRIEIIKGISAGDEVVTAGQNRLNNGSAVFIDNAVDPSKAGQPGSKSE
jgi:membrane fusion protein (multidrug efflux system)